MTNGTSSKCRQDTSNFTQEKTRITKDLHTNTRKNLRKQILYLYGEKIHHLTRTYEKLKVLRASILCDLAFLRNRQDQNLIPTCFQLKFHSNSAATKRILKRTELTLIRNELHTNRFLLDRINKDLLTLHLKLSNKIHPALWDKSKQLAICRAETQTTLKTDTQTNKLRRLQECQKQTPSLSQPHMKQTVHNISDRILTKTETNVLSKGFNFAVTPKHIPTETIICGVETSLTKINPDDTNRIRLKITNILCISKPPKSNLPKEEQTALRNLKEDTSIIILPADKGNATVVMNTSDYQTKLTNLLQDSTYKPLNRDPTTYLEKTTRSKIKASPIREEIQQRIIPRKKSSRCPKLYGLPKIHKEGTPLRPIVSSIGSPL
ncbi:hypothetical protein NXF25_010538 [Crotalus adamanteus]|uniref:Uncharacterized protein n=1 Tax=Crotalus adamanteus TaxID=8729 RepID=A0AAW1BK21_CROAD